VQQTQMSSTAKTVYEKARATLTLLGIENGWEKVQSTDARDFSVDFSHSKSHEMAGLVQA
jgi:hypothetical protein